MRNFEVRVSIESDTYEGIIQALDKIKQGVEEKYLSVTGSLMEYVGAGEYRVYGDYDCQIKKKEN